MPDDNFYSNLANFGFAMAAAGSQPGATLAGSFGQGGMAMNQMANQRAQASVQQQQAQQLQLQNQITQARLPTILKSLQASQTPSDSKTTPDYSIPLTDEHKGIMDTTGIAYMGPKEAADAAERYKTLGQQAEYANQPETAKFYYNRAASNSYGVDDQRKVLIGSPDDPVAKAWADRLASGAKGVKQGGGEVYYNITYGRDGKPLYQPIAQTPYVHTVDAATGGVINSSPSPIDLTGNGNNPAKATQNNSMAAITPPSRLPQGPLPPVTTQQPPPGQAPVPTNSNPPGNITGSAQQVPADVRTDLTARKQMEAAVEANEKARPLFASKAAEADDKLANVTSLANNLYSLAQNGSIGKPGTAMDTRAELAKTVNTVLGSDPKVQEAIANAETSGKYENVLAMLQERAGIGNRALVQGLQMGLASTPNSDMSIQGIIKVSHALASDAKYEKQMYSKLATSDNPIQAQANYPVENPRGVSRAQADNSAKQDTRLMGYFTGNNADGFKSMYNAFNTGLTQPLTLRDGTVVQPPKTPAEREAYIGAFMPKASNLNPRLPNITRKDMARLMGEDGDPANFWNPPNK